MHTDLNPSNNIFCTPNISTLGLIKVCKSPMFVSF